MSSSNTPPPPEDDPRPSQYEGPRKQHQDSVDATPLPSRAEGRDVHVFNAGDPNTAIGGLFLTNGITNSTLYAIVEIIVVIKSDFILRNEVNTTLIRDDAPLQPGNYYIHSACKSLLSSLFYF